MLAIGGCIQCLVRANGFTRASQPSEDFAGLPFFGLGGDGGHVEYAAVDQDLLVPVVSLLRCFDMDWSLMLLSQPDNVKPEHAAVMADAGITAWHAIKTTSAVSLTHISVTYTWLIVSSDQGRRARPHHRHWRTWAFGSPVCRLSRRGGLRS